MDDKVLYKQVIHKGSGKAFRISLVKQELKDDIFNYQFTIEEINGCLTGLIYIDETSIDGYKNAFIETVNKYLKREETALKHSKLKEESIRVLEEWGWYDLAHIA